MRRHILNIVLFALLALPLTTINADSLYSFEGNIPTGWNASKGILSISQEKAKLGKSSLCWDWNAGSILTVTDSNITSTSSDKKGGIRLWIYNDTPTNASIIINFQKTNNNNCCSLPIKLNFEGWRCIWAEYVNDMGLPDTDKGNISIMKICAPKEGSGRLFFDFFEFTSNVSWEKMSDFQYTVNENKGIDSYLEVRNIPNPSPMPPTNAQKAAFIEIEKRLDNWYLGNDKYNSNSIYKQRDKSITSYISKGINREYTINNYGTIRINTGTSSKPVIKESGLLPYDHYHNKQIDGATVVSSRDIGENLMIQLAYDYKKNGNTTSKDKVLELLNWYYDQGWADGSSLGTLRFEMLRSAGYFHSAFMLRKELDTDLARKISDAERWFTRFGTTYITPENPGELADYIRALAIPKLFYALTLSDEGERTTALISFQNYMNNALAHAQGYLGSLKPDGSGYHHHGPYYSAYYPQVLYVGCFLYYILHDTPFALNEESYQNLKEAILNFRFLSAIYNIPGATGGRFPHQTEILQQLIPAFAYLALSKNDAEVIAAVKRLWNPENEIVKDYISSAKTDICYCTTYGEIAAILDAEALNGEAEKNPTGTKYMPYSGLLIVRQPEWVFTIKGFSSYIWDYESSGTENIYGRYLSYGNIEYTDLINGYRSCKLTVDETKNNETWDWRNIPGTTVRYISDEDLDYNVLSKHRNFSDETFLGGIGFDDNHAMFTNKIHDKEISGTFRADKSIFVFGNVVYCMGSNITDTKNAPYFCTTLFQNNIQNNSAITVNGQSVTKEMTSDKNPLIKDNFGNAYIVDGKVQFKMNDNYCTAFINHGTDISTPQSYNYTWLIKPTDEQVTQYKINQPIKVLRQDKTAHAIYHLDDKILAASIFEKDKEVDICNIHKVNIPLLVMTKECDGTTEVAFSNPDMNRPSAANNDQIDEEIEKAESTVSEILIELNGVYTKSKEDNSEISVSSQNGISTLYYPTARDGKTYRVKLNNGSTNNCDKNINKTTIHTFISNDQCNILLSETKEYAWTLMDISGKTIRTGRESNKKTVINIKSLSNGIYFLKITIDNEQQIFKLNK